MTQRKWSALVSMNNLTKYADENMPKKAKMQ